MQYPLAVALVVGTVTGLIAWDDPCPAQTIAVQDGTQNQVPQNPQASQVQPPLPTPGVPGSIITPPTAPGLRGSPVISRSRIPMGIAGRALPGMPGGPPLKGPMGAQDPSASYMRPRVIGPLFCDRRLILHANKFLSCSRIYHGLLLSVFAFSRAITSVSSRPSGVTLLLMLSAVPQGLSIMSQPGRQVWCQCFVRVKTAIPRTLAV